MAMFVRGPNQFSPFFKEKTCFCQKMKIVQVNDAQALFEFKQSDHYIGEYSPQSLSLRRIVVNNLNSYSTVHH